MSVLAVGNRGGRGAVALIVLVSGLGIAAGQIYPPLPPVPPPPSAAPQPTPSEPTAPTAPQKRPSIVVSSSDDGILILPRQQQQAAPASATSPASATVPLSPVLPPGAPAYLPAVPTLPVQPAAPPIIAAAPQPPTIAVPPVPTSGVVAVPPVPSSPPQATPQQPPVRTVSPPVLPQPQLLPAPLPSAERPATVAAPPAPPAAPSPAPVLSSLSNVITLPGRTNAAEQQSLPDAPGGSPVPGMESGRGSGTPVKPGWHEVGSDLNFRAYWDNGLWFETANKDWRLHLGGRFQFEPLFWAQPAKLKGPATGPGGIPAAVPGGGVDSLDDGMIFRRVRFRADGVGYELVEFAMEVNFEQLNYITYDHLWAGLKDVPVLGTVRVGQHKVPMGLDNMGSDYHLTFLERASLTEGIWPALFAPGIFVANNFANNNVSFQTMFHRVQPIVQIFTGDFGDGDYASTTRMTWTPLYAREGASVIHLGNAYQWRHADLGRTIQPGATGNTFADTQHAVRFRARPELRDAIGIGSVGGGLLGGDPARFIDTGFLLASNVHTVSPEFLWIDGPFSIQAEAAWSFVEDAQSIYPEADFQRPRGTPMFWGGYVQASYILTGEHRGYDRRFGTFDRIRVRENSFLVKGDDGRYHWGTGAWEVGYRFSFLDLNSNGINGGQLGQHTFGLNWYLNDNTKVQFQYSNIQRNVISPAVSGTVHGFGMLTQWYF